MMTRHRLLDGLAARLADLASANDRGPFLAAVDGVDGVGKTTFADELATALEAVGVGTFRASVDGFHHPRGVRYRRGRHSPAGFYLDSYDLSAMRRRLLDPLRPGGDRRVVRGQRRYLAACEPQRRATIVVDHTDLASPRIVVDRLAGR
jgi:uridine kinase